jgi:hypothetical protein
MLTQGYAATRRTTSVLTRPATIVLSVAASYGRAVALIEGQRDDATKLFEATAKDCPHGFLEGIAATAELKGLGQKVGAN